MDSRPGFIGGWSCAQDQRGKQKRKDCMVHTSVPTPRTPLVGRVGTTFEWCAKIRFEVRYFRERPTSGERRGGDRNGDKPSPTSIQFSGVFFPGGLP